MTEYPASSRGAMMAALPPLVLRRAFAEKTFVALRLIGLTIAVAFSAGVALYLDAIGQTALNQSLSGHREQDLDIAVRGRIDSVSRQAHDELNAMVESTRSRNLAKVVKAPVMGGKSVTLVFDEEQVPWRNARTFFAHVDDIQRITQLHAGEWPSSSGNSELIEVVISVPDAEYLGVGVDEIFRLSSPLSSDIQLQARITGIYERNDESASQWTALEEGLGARSDAFRITPFIVDEAKLLDVVAGQLTNTELRYYWLFDTEVPKIHSRDAEMLLRELENQESLLRQDVQGYQRITQLDDALAAYLVSSEISIGLMLSVGAVITLASLAFSGIVASQARDIRFAESGMVKARGATASQEITLMAGETVLISIVSLAIGILIAVVGVSFAGRLPVLSELTGGANLPVSMSVQALAAAMGAALIGLLALLLPSFRRDTATAAELTDRLARPPSRSIAQRYYLDVVLLCIGVAALWQLSQEDLYISNRALGEGFSTRLALAMPAATAAGAAIVLLRFLPILLGAIAEGLARVPSALRLSTAIPLALWSVARNPRSKMGLMLLIILAATIGVLLSILSPSISRHAEDDARYRTGADVRLSGMIVRNHSSLNRALRQIGDDLGYDTIAPVARAAGTVSSPNRNEPITILGIDTATFPDAVWWRDDLASDSLHGMARLIKAQDTDGIPIPDGAEWLTALIKPDTQRNDTGLVARIRDETGIYHSLTIGNLEPRSVTVNSPYACAPPIPIEVEEGEDDEAGFEPPDWCRIGIPMQPLRRDAGEDTDLWLEFIGISRRPIENAPRPTTGSVRIMDVSTADGDGNLTLLTDFANILDLRTAGAGFGDLGARIDPYSEEPSEGAVLTWSEPRYRELKGVRIGTSEDALQVIGGAWFRDEFDLEIGDTTRLFLGNRSTTIEFVGFADYFPTFPSASSPYLIADLREVQRMMSIDQTRGDDATNELWVSAPDAVLSDLPIFEDILQRNNVTVRLLQHAASDVVRSRSDALTAAGWNGFLAFGFIALTTVSVLAFLVTAWTNYRLRRLELAVLKSLGLSTRQLLTMIGIEQILVASISMAIGAGIGLILSAVLLPYLSGRDASTLAPPMVVEIGTRTLAILLGVIIAALIAAVSWIFLWVRSQHATTVIRAGGAGA